MTIPQDIAIYPKLTKVFITLLPLLEKGEDYLYL